MSDEYTIPQRLKDAVLAGLAGAGDEASFGLESKYWPAAKKTIEDNPRMAAVGRVGSYFLPVAGEVEALRGALRGGEGLKALSSGLKLSNLQGLLQHGAASLAEKIPGMAAKEGGHFVPEALKAAVKGAGSAIGAGEGNYLIRKGLNTEAGEAPDLTTLGEVGAGGGILGRVLHGKALDWYKHPAIMNSSEPSKSLDQARQLMNEGVFGSPAAFQRHAEGLQEAINPARAKLVDPLVRQGRRTGLQPIMDAISDHQGSYINEPAEKDAFLQSVGNVSDLHPDAANNVAVGDVDKSLMEANSKIKNLNQQMKGRINEGGQGSLPANVERTKAKQDLLGEMLGNAIEQNSPGGKAEWDAARGTYRRGADLESNLSRYEGREMRGHGFHPIEGTVKSPMVRTALGVAANKATPEVAGGIGGELSGLRSRSSQERRQENPFLKEVTAPKTGGTGNVFLDSLDQ